MYVWPGSPVVRNLEAPVPTCHGPDGDMPCRQEVLQGREIHSGPPRAEDRVLCQDLQDFPRQGAGGQGGYNKDAGQKTADYKKPAMVSYDVGLKRRVLAMDRDTDRNWMSTTARVDGGRGKGSSGSAPLDLHKFSKDIAETIRKNLAEVKKRFQRGYPPKV